MKISDESDLNTSASTREEVIDHLLTAVAHEEMALANLLNANATNIHAFIGTELNFPTNPSNQEIISVNKAALKLLRSAVMKDWFLLNKLEEILAFEERQLQYPNEQGNMTEELDDTIENEDETESNNETMPTDATDDMVSGVPNAEHSGELDESQELSP